MNFQKKYFYTFRDINNIVYTIEIWQDTVTVLTPSEIRGDAAPFTIQYPAIKNKFEPVRGSGCEMNLLSATDRQFFGLYTGKMQEYQIRCYRSGVLYWCGFLDSELYREDFSELTNYSVNFTGTDGFALLERLNYLDASSNQFGGMKSQWDTITYIISKLSLPYNNIFVSISTTCPDFTLAAAETIFHKTFVNQSNWIDEDGVASTCRKVLEETLKPYGACIMQDQGNIYIFDINTLAKNNNQVFQKFNAITFAYISSGNINLALGDISSIKMASPSSSFDVVNGINKQIIKYSPYDQLAIFEDTLDSSNFTGSGSATSYSTPDHYSEYEFANSVSWNKFGNGKFKKQAVLNDDSVTTTDTYYLAILPYADSSRYFHINNKSFSCKLALPYLQNTSNYKLKIAFNCYIEKTSSAGNLKATPITVKRCRLFFRIKNSGAPLYNNYNDDNWFNTLQWTNNFYSPEWTTYDAHGYVGVNNAGYFCFDLFKPTDVTSDNAYNNFSYLEDHWFDLKTENINTIKHTVYETDFMVNLLIPYQYNSTGLEIEIYDFACYGIDDSPITSIIKEFRLKDIKFSVVDLTGADLSTSDIEYTSYLDANLKNEGSKITLLQGTNITSKPTQRGGLCANMNYGTGLNKYYYLSSWVREGLTNIIEKLLARSIQSNYQYPTQQLSCTINMIPSIMGCLTYANFLPGKALMIMSCNHDLEEATSQIVIQEVSSDNLTIV